MLSVVLALLVALSGLPLSGMAASDGSAAEAPPSVEVLAADLPGAACCGIASESLDHPCTPGEPCPPMGGCCACVSCGQRVVSMPPPVQPDVAEVVTRHAVAVERNLGTDTIGAVWHPPRG